MRPTVLEIDKNQFIKNINMIKEFVGNKELMPIIKANGYGTYVNKQLDLLNIFNIVGVALVQEAIDIRNIGYTKEIFVLNQPGIEEINDIIENNITIGLSSKEFLKEIIKDKRNIKVHLEIETGMNRTGIKLEDLSFFIKEIKKSNNIIVEGIYSHLSSADTDPEYTEKQYDIFKKAIEIVKENFDNIKYIHCEASNGLLNYNKDFTNLVRPGLIIYGYEPFVGSNKLLNVKPIAKLKTKITYLKELDKGESVGYSRRYTTSKKTKVATIPIGYADGLRKDLFQKGEVLINNKKAKIIGTICMDSCMVDVTNIENVKVGDTVYIWNNKEITLDDIADKCNTINYEIISTISNRVPRVF
jgi:alanine racemase